MAELFESQFYFVLCSRLRSQRQKKPLKHNGTVSPRSSDPFYIVTYYIKWVTTSWTYSIFTWLEYYILGVCNDFAQPPTSGLNSGHRGQVQTDEDEENDLLGQIDQAHTMTARLPGRPVSGARLDLNRDINCALWSFPPPPFLDSFFPRQINFWVYSPKRCIFKAFSPFLM